MVTRRGHRKIAFSRDIEAINQTIKFYDNSIFECFCFSLYSFSLPSCRTKIAYNTFDKVVDMLLTKTC